MSIRETPSRLSKRGLRVFLAIVVVAAPMFRLFFFYHLPYWNSGVLLSYTLTVCRADALAAGIFVALIWRNDKIRSWLSDHGRFLYALVRVLAAGMIALGAWFSSPFQVVQTSVSYSWTALFYGSVMLLSIHNSAGRVVWLARRSWLRELGRVSYCLYLIHLAVSMAILAVLHSYGHSSGVETSIANMFAAILSYLIARASWTYFENPLVQRGRMYRYSELVDF